jgi:hypothetical protein
MILEGIVTSLSGEGDVNIAPMGPEVGAAMDRFVLKPFRSAQTYRNLKAHGEGVLHVTDDVLLLARSALGDVEPMPAVIPAHRVRGRVLRDACRYHEFQVRSLDDRNDRTRIEVEVVHSGRLRDFFGFNRAKHAVVEAAILATRTDFLPLDDIVAEYRKLAVIVAKTGGDQEKEAMAFLQEHIGHVARSRGLDPGREHQSS